MYPRDANHTDLIVDYVVELKVADGVKMEVKHETLF